MEPASYRIEGGRTIVPLRLQPAEAVFVVFRQPAAQPTRALPVKADSVLAAVDGAWDVSFQAGRGAPAKLTFDTLAAWNTNSDAGVKYSRHGQLQQDRAGAGRLVRKPAHGSGWISAM